MTFYADLADCGYFAKHAFAETRLVAIGWLKRGMPFTTGDVDPRFVERVRDWHRKQRFAIFLGSHECDLPACLAERPWDTGEILVKHREPGTLYVMPMLATHYVHQHRYRPPQEFIDAVMAATDDDIPRIVMDAKQKKIFWDEAGGGPPEVRFVP